MPFIREARLGMYFVSNSYREKYKRQLVYLRSRTQYECIVGRWVPTHNHEYRQVPYPRLPIT